MDRNKVGIRGGFLIRRVHNEVPHKGSNANVDILNILVGVKEAAGVTAFLLIAFLRRVRHIAVELKIG